MRAGRSRANDLRASPRDARFATARGVAYRDPVGARPQRAGPREKDPPMTADPSRRSAAALPPPNLSTLTTVLVAGALATVAFDLFGQALSPLAGFANLAPVPLARQSVNVLFGVDSNAMGHLMHYVAGLVAYPVGWIFVARPILARLAPSLGWFGASAVYGVGLWIFALYVMAHLVAGNPAFLGFTGIAWVALVGHVLFAVVAAFVTRLRARA